MKNINKNTILLSSLAFVFSMVFAVSSANAFLLPPKPWDVTSDLVASPLMIPNKIAKGVNKAQAMYNETAQKVNNMAFAMETVKMAISTRNFSGLGKAFKSSNPKTPDVVEIPGAREISNVCDLVNVNDVDSIKNGMYQLFMALPSNDQGVNKRYTDYGKRFYQDTLLELYTAADQVQNKVPELEFLVGQLPDKLNNGEDGAKEGNNQLAVLENAKISYEVMDQIMQVREELMSLKAQYEAAKNLEFVRPDDYIPENDTGSVSYNDVFESNVKYANSEHLVFAQRNPENYVYDPEKSGAVTFRAAPPSAVDSPYAGNEEAIAQLEKLEPLYKKAQETLEIHNLIQNLPTYKSIFDEYERQVRMHEKSVEDLKISDKCVLDYLGRYYKDPEQTWNGRKLGGLVNEYSLRKGLSGWAIKAFDVAKAQSTDPTDNDSFGSVDISGEIDLDNAANVGDPNKVPNISLNISGLDKPSQESSLENNNREVKMLTWKIGAEAAKMLVQDQYSDAPQWGTPYKKFPIWTDQKNFYNQYIDGKYDNMKDYVRFIDTRSAVINVSVILNKIETKRKVDEQETREGKNRERLKGLERNGELLKVSRLISIDLERSLNKAQDTSELERIEDIYNTNYSARTNEYLEAKKPYEDRSLSPKERDELAKIETDYKLDVQDLQIKRHEDTSDYEISRVNQLFTDELNSNADREVSAVTDLENRKSREIDDAIMAKNAILMPLEAKKDTLNSILDAATQRLSQYNEEIEKLHSKIQEAKAEAAYRRKEVDNVLDYFGEDPRDEISVEEKEKDYTKTVVVGKKKNLTIITDETNVIYDANTDPEIIEKETITTIVTEEIVDAPENEADESAEMQVAPAKADGVQLFRKRPNLTPEAVDRMSFFKYTDILRFAQQEVRATSEEVGEKVERETYEGDPDNFTMYEDAVERTTIETIVETEYDTTGAQQEIAHKVERDTYAEEEDILITEEKSYTEKELEKIVKSVDETKDQIDDLEKKIDISTEIIDVEGKNIEDLRAFAKEEQLTIEQTRKLLKDIDVQIDSIEAYYITVISGIETNYANRIDSAVSQAVLAEDQAAKNVSSVLSIYQRRVDRTLSPGSFIGSAVFSQVESVISQAQNLVRDAEKYAHKLIDDARDDIYTTGDSLYLPKTNGKIVTKHNNLTEKLKSLSSQGLMSSSNIIKSYASKPEILKELSNMYAAAITRVACHKKRCSTPDIQYFVGHIGKAKDFAAPKSPPASYLPPLREVVHFDDVDYENVPKSSNGVITKDGFLSYGGDIPEIWKLILDEKAFVEKGLDLDKMFNQGGEALSFLNGGLYPCNYKEYTVSIDPKQDNYIVNSLIDPTYPQCRAIEVQNRKSSMGITGGEVYYSLYDIEGDVSGKSSVTYFSRLSDLLGFEMKKPNATLAENTSELGVLLTLRFKELGFSDVSYKVFQRLKVIGEEAEKENSKYKTSLRDELYNRAPLDNNQIGDFLRFVEREQEMKQIRDELAMGVMEIKELLFDSLKAVGYEPSDDLDLSKQEDFDLVRSKLDTAKNDKIAEALTDVSVVNVQNNTVAEERLDRIKAVFDALQKDKDELVALSEMTSGGSELDEAIKAAEVNKEAMDEYSKKADEEMEKQLKNTPRPYCAIY